MSELVLLLSSITEVVVGVGAGVAAGSGAPVGDGSVAGARVAVDVGSGAEPGDIAGVPGGAVDDRFSVGGTHTAVGSAGVRVSAALPVCSPPQAARAMASRLVAAIVRSGHSLMRFSELFAQTYREKESM